MKKILGSLFICFTLIFLMSTFVNAMTKPCGLNYEPSKLKKLLVTRTMKNTTLDNICDLTSKMPPIGNQENIGSCASWATGYALQSHLEADDFGWTLTSTNHQFSPNYLYNQIVKGIDAGSSFKDNFDILTSQGCCTLNLWPYSSNISKQPTTTQTNNAKNFKALEWFETTTYGDDNVINTVKEYLFTEKDPVVMGIPVGPDFDTLNSSNPIYDTLMTYSNGQYFRGGHAITIIGYNDTKQAFKIQNSWGKNWGINGYGYISYDLIKNAIFNDWMNYGGYPTYAYCLKGIPQKQDNQITFNNAKLLKNTGIGSKFSLSVKVNGTNINEGRSIYTLDRNCTIKIVEDDPKKDDVAIKTITLKPGINKISMTIYENPKNGKYAKWEFIIVVGKNPIQSSHIKLTNIKVIKNTGIGSSFTNKCLIGGVNMHIGQTVRTKAKTAYLKCTENDPKYDDIAYRTTTLDSWNTSRDVKVYENPKNGKYAIIRYYFEIN